MEILHFWYQNAISPCRQRVPRPCRRPPFWGVQNSIISIKNRLNFEVTFTCHVEPLYGPTWLQLSPNLASKILPRPVSRRCWNATSWKAHFCTPSNAKCKFLLLQGAPKTSKNAFQDHFLYERLFNWRKKTSKLRFCSNLAPSWASQGAPKRPPRPLKNHSWRHLGPS